MSETFSTVSAAAIFAAARRTLHCIARGLASRNNPYADEVLRRLAEQRLVAEHFHMPEPCGLPVLRFLPDCVGEAMLLDAGLAAGLAALEEHLHWRQSASYSDAVLGEGFTANYGWAELVGPNGFFHGDDFLLGVLMLGPGRHYRDHYHPAPELYWPLTQGSQWRRAPGGFEEKPAGAIIWHEPNQIHATITGSHPLLAVWAWTRDTATPARLVDQA